MIYNVLENFLNVINLFYSNILVFTYFFINKYINKQKFKNPYRGIDKEFSNEEFEKNVVQFK